MNATELLIKYPTLWQLAIIMEDAVSQVERDERYTMNMQFWHLWSYTDIEESDKGKCLVCAAGAVMAKYLDRDIKDDLLFIANQPDDEEKLANIFNDLRMGCIGDAHRALYGKVITEGQALNFYLDKYDHRPANWHANVKCMIASLKEWNI